MSLANISIVGNLVRTPEEMHFVSGKVKTTFTVAVNSFGKPARGGDTADFYRVETWGKLAELASKYLEKGNQIAVSGRLLFDRFVDREGKNRVIPVVEANQLSLPPKPKMQSIAGTNTSENEPVDDNAALSSMQGTPVSGHLLVELDDNQNDIDTHVTGLDSEVAVQPDLNVVEMENKVKVRKTRLEKVV